ncbi:hypothetical protein LXA43DRAFT_1001250 [Ganoderma leucocontextum]|nr:hypothetical protein LXA43DRAFT_1001250 [Ganoderma leucocontextum]
MSSDPESSPPARIQAIPAPWNVKAEAWWFITSIGHRPDPSESLPISYFPAHETELYRTSVQQDAFRGGRGSITLTRYTDSPIGPFDELSISPGEFTNPFEDPSHRVTRAYVSSLPAVVNGRSNWGLPRELAQFIFTPSLDRPDAVEVRVFPAISFEPVSFAETACFAALIKPVSWLPSIPASLTHFLQVKLFQPPLEASSDPAQDGLVGTPKWHALDASAYKGRAKPFRCEGLLTQKDVQPSVGPEITPAKRKIHKMGVADGFGFPDVEPYSVGIYWPEVELTLPRAVPLATL